MYTPNIVEYQCGSSDISQSMPAKVAVMQKTTSPGALSTFIRRSSAGFGF